MLVACLGDVMLDVIVEVQHGLSPTTTPPRAITFAAGGQAANVATWVRALGGRARVFGPRADTGPGHLVEARSPPTASRCGAPPPVAPGAVISLVSDGSRSMASDPGDLTWLDEVRSGAVARRRRLAVRVRLRAAAHPRPAAGRRDRGRRPGARHPDRGRPRLRRDGLHVRRRPRSRSCAARCGPRWCSPPTASGPPARRLRRRRQRGAGAQARRPRRVVRHRRDRRRARPPDRRPSST